MLSQKRFLQYDFTEEFAFLKSSGWKSLLYAAIFNVAGQIMSFITQPYITPVVNAILSQILVPILMVLSAMMFSTRYIFLEILGVVIIIMADIITSVVTISDKSDEAVTFMTFSLSDFDVMSLDYSSGLFLSLSFFFATLKTSKNMTLIFCKL